jgi:uncharacterized protein
MSTVIERATFPDLGREQCIALTTFRKTGQAVTTPVWFAQSLGTIYVETHADAGKLKRLHHFNGRRKLRKSTSRSNPFQAESGVFYSDENCE